MKRTPPRPGRLLASQAPDEAETTLAERFHTHPAQAFHDLIVLYAEMIKRMIRRFFRDWDDVMEVFTSVCERLQAHDFRALRRFKKGSPIEPWLGVVAANASRDHARRQRVGGVPPSVLEKLDPFERLVYRYHYTQHLPHEDIAEMASSRFATSYGATDVRDAIDKIDTMLGAEKRWRILSLISLRSRVVSVDSLIESGLDPEGEEGDTYADVEAARRVREHLTEAFEAMEPEDQLLLQLRFEQDMTAVQIADVMGYENYKQVYTRLRTVIDRMRRIMEKHAS